MPERPKSIPPTEPADTPDEGGLGTAITLRGENTELEVTARRLLDPAPAGPSDTPLGGGSRFVGIALELRNIGDAPYSESPLEDAKLTAAGGRNADPVNLLGGPCGGGFALHLTLPPGERRTGCVAFEVRRGEVPTTFRFALDSGFASEVGTWRLR